MAAMKMAYISVKKYKENNENDNLIMKKKKISKWQIIRRKWNNEKIKKRKKTKKAKENRENVEASIRKQWHQKKAEEIEMKGEERHQ